MSTPRIAVIGTGTIGAQTLWQLSKLGARVTGYELYSPGHSRGAAGGENRLFRYIEAEHPEYVPVIERADVLWRELEEESGRTLRSLNGAMAIATEGAAATATALLSAERRGARAQVLTREETAARFPQYRLAEDEFSILDLDAGVIFPERTVLAAATAAVARGAELRRECRVTGIEQVGDQVAITSDGVRETYDQVVVAAGAWTAELLPEMAPYLSTRRLLSAWFLPGPGTSTDGLLPYMRLEPRYSYGLPTADGLAMKLGVGFADHRPVTSPDGAEMSISDADLAPLRAVARDLFPGFEDYPLRAQAYFEAYTHTRREYMAAHPTMPSVFVCAGFSGKGFKNSPYFGELAARTVLGMEPSIEDGGFVLDTEHVRRE
ncbi:FAD-dependent oxidoreductase [Galactobacter valiniphilus]|uniref:FAD-dependent oxidoreductase n=1 Tax=Galactobacter valiniphilus TaxID=2676122 RepID=UPI0037363D31